VWESNKFQSDKRRCRHALGADWSGRKWNACRAFARAGMRRRRGAVQDVERVAASGAESDAAASRGVKPGLPW